MQLLPMVLAARSLSELVASASMLTPLARSVGSSHSLSVLYEDMQRQVVTVLDKRPTAQSLRFLIQPSGLFHVAIDCPGCGRSPGDARAITENSEALLADVVRCLGKRHAVAIVGGGRAATYVLRAISAQPNLTSFVAMRDPSLELCATAPGHAPWETSAPGRAPHPRAVISSLGLTTVLQPTLIVLDALVNQPKDAEAAAEPEHLRRSLPICSLVEASGTKKVPAARQMAAQIFALCEAHEWRAHLPDLGATDLPLLSRLAGGVTAWAKRGAPASQSAGSGSAASSKPRPRAKSAF